MYIISLLITYIYILNLIPTILLANYPLY